MSTRGANLAEIEHLSSDPLNLLVRTNVGM